MLSLLAGLWGALGRLGFGFPPPGPHAIVFHGPLMVSGFLGTLVALERAVGLGRPWGLAAPLAAGAGALSLVVAPGTLGLAALALGGLLLALILLAAWRLQPSFAGMTLVVGALAWCTGSVLLASGLPVSRVVPWWIAFLVVTIAGERLELARFLVLGPRRRTAFAAALLLLLAGAVLSLPAPAAGMRLLGAGALGLAAWLSAFDMARRGIRRPGLTRFTAACLLSGYVWLGIAGVLALAFGAPSAGPRYDALLHCVFLGFVMAMIFGHAPIIFPAIVARPIPFRPVFYVHLALLHLTLLLRVAGDLAGAPAAVRYGGLGNVLAVLLFLLATAGSLLRGVCEAGPATRSRGPARLEPQDPATRSSR
jgi:hypothetical protein